jgi:hypothetical protein
MATKNPSISTHSAAGLTITATRRTMKSYNILDVELGALGLAQGVSAVAFGFGTGLLTFCFEIKKDLMLVGGKSVESVSLDFSVNHFGFPAAIVFYLIGIATFFYFNSTVRRIKRDSEQI